MHTLPRRYRNLLGRSLQLVAALVVLLQSLFGGLGFTAAAPAARAPGLVAGRAAALGNHPGRSGPAISPAFLA